MRPHLMTAFPHIGVLALVLVLRLVTTRRGCCSRTVRFGAVPGDWLVHRRWKWFQFRFKMAFSEILLLLWPHSLSHATFANAASISIALLLVLVVLPPFLLFSALVQERLRNRRFEPLSNLIKMTSIEDLL